MSPPSAKMAAAHAPRWLESHPLLQSCLVDFIRIDPALRGLCTSSRTSAVPDRARSLGWIMPLLPRCRTIESLPPTAPWTAIRPVRRNVIELEQYSAVATNASSAGSRRRTDVGNAFERHDVSIGQLRLDFPDVVPRARHTDPHVRHGPNAFAATRMWLNISHHVVNI